MQSWRRAMLFGFLVWLAPFVVSFVVFPLRADSRPLFESIMAVSVAAATVAFALAYLKPVRRGFAREGLAVGLLWLAISLLIDAPLFLLEGPMQMSAAAYLADVGLTYLIIPTVTWGLGCAAERAARPIPA